MFLQLGRAGTSMLGKVSRLPVLTPAFTPLLPWSGPSCDYSGSSSIHTRHHTTTNTLQWRKVRESNHGYTALYTAAAAALVTVWKIYHMVHNFIYSIYRRDSTKSFLQNVQEVLSIFVQRVHIAKRFTIFLETQKIPSVVTISFPLWRMPGILANHIQRHCQIAYAVWRAPKRKANGPFLSNSVD